MPVECGGVRGNLFESICGWSGPLQWRFMCALLCPIWTQFRQHSFQSAKENETEKNGEQRAENRKRKTETQIENEKRFADTFLLLRCDRRQTTVGVASDARWMMIYMCFIWVAFSLLTEERRERERERARTTKLSPWGQGEGGWGGLGAYWGCCFRSAVFCFQSSVFVMRSLTDFVAQELWEKSIRKAI